MAGGGTMQEIADKAPGEDTSLKTALTGQAPAIYAQRVFSDYAPINVAALQNAQPTAQPSQAAPSTVNLPGFQGVVNPFRSAGQNPALSIPGFQGAANPFYRAPQLMRTVNPQANTLASQYQLYQQKASDQLAAAAAQRQADAYAAQQAYETARGNKELQAKYQSQIDSLTEQLAAAQAAAANSGGDSSNNNYWYASGGIASLAGNK